MVCADDKAETVARLLASPDVSVMCGDSLSDLSSLVQADYGIVLGTSSTLRRFLAISSIRLVDLSTGEVTDDQASIVGVQQICCS